MNKMNPEIKALWLTALRSGEYKQGRASLKFEDRYCCLGVLCELAAKAGVAERVEVAGTDVTRYDGVSAYMPESVQEWAGLDSEDGKLQDEMKFSRPSVAVGGGMLEGTALTLVSLNDVAHYDFNQIADVIEAQF